MTLFTRLCLLTCVILTFSLAGCGYKGPLSLPEPAPVSDTAAND